MLRAYEYEHPDADAAIDWTIALSVQHEESVTLEYESAALRAELRRRCDDCVEECGDYWGTTETGDHWRVYLECE